MKKTVERKVGPFKTYTIEGRPGGACVVLFHGYGADASDLVPLAEMSNLSPDVTWVFPDAPLEIIIAPGFSGRAWFQIDIRRLENALKNGEPSDLSLTVPDGLAHVKKGVDTFYSLLRGQHSRVIVGGFSQGAMLATDLFLSSAQKPDGLVILSGTLINKKDWATKLKSVVGHHFFQSHGKNDALLGYDFAESLHQFLVDGGMHGEFLSFNGGHEIPPKIIEKMGLYLRQCIR